MTTQPAEPAVVFARQVGTIVTEVIAPMRGAWQAIQDAADQEDDDAALGRRTREIVQDYAAARGLRVVPPR